MVYFVRNSVIGLAAILLASAASAAAANDVSAASKAVWDGHLQKVMTKDLDAVMTDFTDQSAIVTVDKVYAGTAEIRGFLENVFKGFTPEVLKSMVMKAEIPHDNVVFSILTVGAAKRTFIYTTVIKDGKIMAITESPGFAAE
jgi:hypothetical protein